MPRKHKMKLKLIETKIEEKIIYYSGYRIRLCLIRFEINKSVSEQQVAFISKHEEGTTFCEICFN